MSRADNITSGKRGLIFHDDTRFVPRMEHYVTGPLRVADLPPANGDVDRVTKVPTFPMYDNDKWGNCVWAMFGHSIQCMTAYASEEVTVPVESLMTGYEVVTGFNPNAGPPGNNPTDNGTAILDGLKYWQNPGIADSAGKAHKVVAFAKFGDPTDEVLMAQWLNVAGSVLLAYELQQAQEDQFNNGWPWQFVNGSNYIGGHAICNQRRAVGGVGVIKDVTWGAVEGVTRLCHRKIVREVWGVATEDWLNGQGQTIQGYKMDQLISDMKFV